MHLEIRNYVWKYIFKRLQQFIGLIINYWMIHISDIFTNARYDIEWRLKECDGEKYRETIAYSNEMIGEAPPLITAAKAHTLEKKQSPVATRCHPKTPPVQRSPVAHRSTRYVIFLTEWLQRMRSTAMLKMWLSLGGGGGCFPERSYCSWEIREKGKENMK